MRQLETPQLASQWLKSLVPGALHSNSQKIKSGDGFIAWPGAVSDGRLYVQAALEAGASACLVETQGAEKFGLKDARITSYSGLKAATGLIAAEFYQHPSGQLDVVAITGTNGKTSTAWWLAQALNHLKYGSKSNDNLLSKSELLEQYSCGLVGTLGVGTPEKMVFTGNTTPDPVLLQRAFADMLAAGAHACAIEATSIGLAEQRLAGVAIRTAVFTNFTQDHLDYHGTMQAYWAAKLELFDWQGLQDAVVNLDDPLGQELADHCATKALKVWTVSQLRTDARLWTQDVRYTDIGLEFTVCEGSARAQVQCAVLGSYNVDNLLCALGALRSLGVSLIDASQALSHCTAVPGRMECVTAPNAPMVAVDYAHTPDALDKVLSALRPVAQARSGQLWCVFGCGGDRDNAKRPIMAAIAQAKADQLVVTSDNPRSEAAHTIIDHMIAGLKNPHSAHIQADRALAIAYAIEHAQVEDIVLIAGKGAEDYQDINGIKHPFKDLSHAKAAIDRYAPGAYP